MSTVKTTTATVKPGHTLVLKAGVKIISVVKEGSIQATSTCTDIQQALDNAEDMACFRVLFVAEGNENDDTGPFSWTNGDMKVMGLGLGNQFYDMENFTFNGYSSDTLRSQAFVTRLKEATGDSSPIRPHSMTNTGEIGERDEFKFIFSAPESMGKEVYLKISSPSGGDPSLAIARFYAESCDGCCPSSG